MLIARRYIIRGRVQGVGYRYFAIHAAQSCRVVGTVRNRADGNVEVVAEGPAGGMAEFRSRLEKGPTMSRVTGIDETELKPTGRYEKFDVEF